MYYVFIAIIVLASILLTLTVLLQNSKGGGLASNFTAGNTTFGVRRAADMLEKATWWLAGIVIVFSIAATASIPNSGGSRSNLEEQVNQTSAPAGIDFGSVTNQNPATLPVQEKSEEKE